jgi:hypothetical protein
MRGEEIMFLRNIWILSDTTHMMRMKKQMGPCCEQLETIAFRNMSKTCQDIKRECLIHKQTWYLVSFKKGL